MKLAKLPEAIEFSEQAVQDNRLKAPSYAMRVRLPLPPCCLDTSSDLSSSFVASTTSLWLVCRNRDKSRT
jgi:hypothetical protein